MSQAIELIGRTSAAAAVFVEQSVSEKRELLETVMEKAVWKGGELRMSLFEPFEKMRLSNRTSYCNDSNLHGNSPILDNWRRERDSNPR